MPVLVGVTVYGSSTTQLFRRIIFRGALDYEELKKGGIIEAGEN